MEPDLSGLPEQTGPGMWDARLGASPAEWSRALSAEELSALGAAADSVLAASPPSSEELSLQAVDAAAAALPPPVLARWRAARDDELLRGRGFCVLRGLPVKEWGDARAAAAFAVLARSMGALRQQNGHGHVLGHVTDLGLSSSDPNVRVYQTHERQTFHTDSCDVVGLLMLRPARQGGESFLVSAGAVFNEMRARCPGLLRHLLRPLATDRRGEVPAGMLPFFTIPVFSLHAGFLDVIYQRQYIDSAQRFAEAPRLGTETVAALDAFDALCDDPRMQVRMRLEPGDMQLVHNHALLHDRSAFEDFGDDDDDDDDNDDDHGDHGDNNHDDDDVDDTEDGGGGRDDDAAADDDNKENGVTAVSRGSSSSSNRRGSSRRRRHLLRVWIAPEPPAPVRPLPEAFAQRFGSVLPGRRGGVELAGVAPVARVVPPPRAKL
jgi:hypothetical protein